MVFVNYKNTNNASSLLISDITASATTILITDGDQGLFPSSFPFLLTLEHLDANDNVILREIVKVVANNQNTFTIERSAGTCVQDDTATNRVQDNTAHAFSAGDRVSLYWTAEQVADIQNNLELKGNQDAIANVYDNSLTYAVGDIVVYKGDRYICSTAVSTPEEFDPTKWTKVNVQYELDDQDARITALENAGGSAMQVDVLIVGGGGGGGGGGCYNGVNGGGGGGAGEVLIKQGYVISQKNINIVVGTGGNGGTHGQTGGRGGTGGLSRFGNLVAIGGGGGGGGIGNSNSSNGNGGDGGSGGGVGGFFCACFAGINPTLKAGIALGLGGHNGGVGYHSRADGGGGGGAGRPGGKFGLPVAISYDMGYQFADIGGNGIITNFGGEYRCIGGGGGGAVSSSTATNFYCNCRHNNSCLQSLNGINNILYNGVCFGGGIGGYLATNDSKRGGNGWNNTGGGGGGGIGNCSQSCGGAGGSGLVIVRYPKDCSYGIACATGGTITTPTINGIQYVVHTFTSGTGTFCITETA